MKTILLSRGFHNPSDAERSYRYSVFVHWLKTNHGNFYKQYSAYFTIPTTGMKIVARMDYIQPEHKLQIKQVLDEFNVMEGSL